MSTLNIESQSLNPSSLITLYELDCSSIGAGIYHFCSEKEVGGSSISFNNVFYQQIDLKAEGFEWTSDGTLPRPKLSVSTINSTFYSLVVATTGAQGCVLKRTRTFAKFLDSGEYGSQHLSFPVDVYIIDRILSFTKNSIEWELITPMDIPNAKIPSRLAMRDLCPWIYRSYNKDTDTFEYDNTSNACPYTGDRYSDNLGMPCTKDKDSCGHRLSDCVYRHGTARALPFGGFVGLAQNRS